MSRRRAICNKGRRYLALAHMSVQEFLPESCIGYFIILGFYSPGLENILFYARVLGGNVVTDRDFSSNSDRTS